MHPAADLIVITDHPPPDPVTDGILWLAFGEPRENLAIVSAVRNPGSATHARCLVEVANYSNMENTARINWSINNQSVHAESVTIPANASKTLEQRFPAPSEDISMQLDLARSNIHMTPAWPVLFWNLINWRLAERSGFTYANYHSGIPFEIRAPYDESVSVTDPSGKTTQHSARGGRVLISSRAPGIYTASVNNQISRASLNTISP